MADNNKYTDNFKKVIKAKLDEIAASDEAFAESYAKESKTIDSCINYILDTVQKSGVQGFTDDEVYGMAMHYYDEDDIKDPGSKTCKVIVNHTVELTEEEKEELRKKARDEVYNEHKRKLSSKPKAKPTEAPKQASLF